MNIDMIVNLIKSVPKDKLNDDETLKTLFDLAIKESGISYKEYQINQLLQQFKKLREGSPATFISMLLKSGVSKSQIDDIKNKLNS